jgi:hypothetical protein
LKKIFQSSLTTKEIKKLLNKGVPCAPSISWILSRSTDERYQKFSTETQLILSRISRVQSMYEQRGLHFELHYRSFRLFQVLLGRRERTKEVSRMSVSIYRHNRYIVTINLFAASFLNTPLKAQFTFCSKCVWN